MTEIERLVAIEEIKQLKARYFRCIDTKDWTGWQAVFAADAVLDAREDRPPGTPESEWLVTGAATIVNFAKNVIQSAVTVHHGHMPEIEFTSDTTAKGVWAMEDLIRWTESSSPFKTLHGFGHYHETYERVGGRWVIKTLKLTRLRLEHT